MFNFGISKRLVASIQAFASLGLIILAFIFSLTPLFNIDTNTVGYGERGGSMKDAISESVSEYSGVELLPSQIDDEIGVSPIKLIRVAVLYAKVIKRNIAYDKEIALEIEEWISTESGREDIIIVSALSEMMGELGKRAGGNESGLSIIFNIVFRFLSFISVLILTLILPIILLIKMIAAIIAALSWRSRPEKISGKLGASLPAFLNITLVYMVMQCLSSAFGFGFGTVMIVALGIASALLNALMVRQMSGISDKEIYLDSVQGSAIVSAVGFLIFFFNILSAGALRAFCGGRFSEYTAKISSVLANDPSAEIQSGYMFDGIMMLIYVFLLFVCAYYLERALGRLALGGAKKEHNILGSVFAVAVCVIPLIISGVMHYYSDPQSLSAVGDSSFLPKDSFGFGNLIGALVGACIMLVGDIGGAVLVRVFSKGESEEEKKRLLSGRAMREFMADTSVGAEPVAEPKEDTSAD